jgi:hypothetical protein
MHRKSSRAVPGFLGDVLLERHSNRDRYWRSLGGAIPLLDWGQISTGKRTLCATAAGKRRLRLLFIQAAC